MTAALVSGTVLATGGVASAAVPNAQSQGQFLSGTVTGGDLATLASVAPASASAAPDTTDIHPLSATALNSATVNLGTGVNLLGQNGILTLGAVNQYAKASTDGSSSAASGAVGNDGSIGIGANGAPNPGIAPSNATLNLASVIAGTPALQTALSAATVNIGAVAGTANETAAGVQSGAYKIGSLNLNLTSPLVSGVYTQLNGLVGTTLATLNAIPLVGNVPTAAQLLAPLTNITSADGSFTVNLQTGVVGIDVAKLIAGQTINGQPGNISNLPPNTNLLPYITAGLTSQLLPAITNAITGTGGVVQTLTTRLGQVTVAGLAIGLGVLNPILTVLTNGINPVVSGLGANVITPLANGLTGLVALTANVQPTPPNATPQVAFSQAALTIGVVPTGDAASITLANATVGPNAGPPGVPTATGLTPASGPVSGGTTVTVTGTGFVPGATTVNVDGVNQAATATSATSLTFVTPAHGIGAVPVTVTTAGGTSDPALSFTYLAVPTIATVNGLTPNSGPVAGNTTVTVTGTGFVPGATTVNVDGVNQSANATSTTTLTFVTPAHAAGGVPVTVRTAGGTSTPAQTFTFLPVPTITITGLSPNSGPVAGNTTVTVTGTGFVPGATTVNVDGVNQSANATSTTTLTFVTPAHAAGGVDVTAQTAGGTSGPRTFTFVPVPTIATINGLSPNSGPVAGNTTVTVTGTGFVPGATTVNVDGVNQTANATSATTLTFVTPAHAAGGVPVTVQTAGGISGPQTFTFVPVPTIATINGLSPNSGPVAGNTTVTVTGTGFVPGATTVNVDGVNQDANATSATTLTFVTPAHAAGGVDVTVQTAGGTSGPQTFTFVPVPTITITGLSPNSGPVAGNTTVTVTGTGFVPGATTVNVDGVNQAANATSATTLTFVTPAHAAGGVDVTAQTAGGISSPPRTFTFVPVPTIATINGLSPNSGPVAGNTTVTVTGTGFVPGATTVNVDGVNQAANATSATTLTFVTPAHAAGGVDVTVQTAGGISGPQTFTFVPVPTIATINGLAPNSGPVAGNTTVTVTGTGFVPGATTVNVDGVNQAANATSATTLTFVTPAHAAGGVDVTVQTAGGTSGPQTFTFVPVPTIATINGLSPNSGPVAGNTTVTVTGTGFVPGATTVNVDGVNQAANATSATTLTFVTPAHAAGGVPVTVQTAGGVSAPQTFTFLDVPTATSLSPGSGPVAGNTTVTVTGTGFVPGATLVYVDSTPVVATVTSPTTLTFSTPAHPAGSVAITVQTNGGTSAPALPFTYLPVPTATSLTPTSGPVSGNTPVTITGTGFVDGATTVTIGGITVPAGSVMIDGGGTTATFATPAHSAGQVAVVVTTAGGASTPALTYTYLVDPNAASLTPTSGPVAGGTTVTITGTDFVAGATSVTIGGTTVPAASVTVNTDGTTAAFDTPAHAAGLVSVVATTAGGSTTTPLGFTYVDIPTTTSLSPTSGPVAGGTTVTITGTAFVQGGTTVTIGGTTVPAAAVTVSGDGTTAMFSTPAHAAGEVDDVVVTTIGGTSTPALSFTYLPVPTAASLSPTSGPTAGNTPVTITGTGFVSGATTVTIGAITVPAANVTVSPDGTMAMFATPRVSTAGTVQVVATTAGGSTTPTLPYTYLNIPGAVSLAPTSGPVAGGTSVTITGTDFVDGATSVTIGGITVPAASVTVNSDGTKATFFTPAHVSGLVSVVATTAGGSTTPPLGFNYLDIPTAASLDPTSGPVAGNTTVTVTGTGFVPGATTVNVDGVNQAANATSATTLTFVTPAHAAGGVPVTVQTAGGTSGPQTFTFVVVPTIATINGLSPNSGPVAGNTTVTVTGTGFVPGATTVNVDGVNQAANATSATTLTFVTPAHAAGGVPVTVQTAGGVSGPQTFTFVPVPTIATINGLSPNSGPVAGNTTVTVTGTGFVPGATTVNVDGVNQAANATSATTLTFVTPAHAAGGVPVTVQTAGGISGPQTFTFVPVPTIATINGLSPNSGPVAGNTTVTVTGTGFVPGATTVNVDGVNQAANATSATTLTFVTPAHAAGGVPVTVQTAGGVSGPQTFTFVPVPTIATINGLSPNSGPVAGNTTVTVTGTGFVPGATTVNVDGVNQAANATSATTLTFVTPAHAAGGVPVTVQTAGGTSGPQIYTFLDVPTATSLSPDNGPVAGNTTVMVTGTGFVPGATLVYVDSTPVVATVISPTTLTFSTPAHPAGSAAITVQTNGGTSAPALPFTYLPVPTATSLSPSSGPTTGLTPITLTGSGFVPGQTTVTIGGLPGVLVTVISPTQLTFTTPPHTAGLVGVTVTTPGGTSTPALPFVYGAPVATSLTPTHGPAAGGTSVVVTGSGFLPGGTSILIGGNTVPATAVAVNATGTTATFSTPEHVAGEVQVQVQVGSSTSAALQYTYDPPTATSLTPDAGPIAGGTPVIITGTGFVPGETTVTIGGTTIPAIVAMNGTTAMFTTPAHAAGAVPVTVDTPEGTTASVPALTFTYEPVPTLTPELSPNKGPETGGTPVTLTGTGFVPDGTTILIGLTPATATVIPAADVTVNANGTVAHFVTRPNPPGRFNVYARTAGGTSAPLPFTFQKLTALSLTPDHGPITGGTLVTVTGTAFVPRATTVRIGGITVPAALVTVSADGSTATFRTPAHVAGGVAVTLTTADGTTSPLGYQYGGGAVGVTSCVITGAGPTGQNAATVSVAINTGFRSGLVPSVFSVQAAGRTAGSTPVTPAAGGFTTASISVPVATGTTTVGYQVAPKTAGIYPAVTGTIACTGITPVQAKAGIYFPLTPARLLDTRHALGATQSLAPGATITLKVLGKGGIPATGVATVVLNTTVTGPVNSGYLTSYPGGTARPNTSSINFSPGQTVANLVSTKVGADGTVQIYNGSKGSTEVIADVAGYFSSGQTVAPGSFVPVTPARLLDTSDRVGVPTNTFVPSGGTVKLKVTGVGGVPATNVSAVTLNVTAAQPTRSGFITVYPSTSAKPYVSSLNFVKGSTDANLVIAPVGTDGTVTLYNGSKGTVRLVADVSGFFRGGVAVLNGEYVAVSPSRILDTRVPINVAGKVPAKSSIAPTMVGRNRIPATGVSAVFFNLTVTSTTAPGFVTAYPNTLPLASNVNFVAKQDQPNAVISPVGSGGKIRLFNGSTKPVDLVADVSGYFIKR